MGTDTFPPDMTDNMRQGLNICHIMDGGAHQATAADFYNAATLGGAKALGHDDIGRLCPGAKADITVFDLSGFHIGQVTDPVRSMVLAGSGRDFRAAFIDGKPVMEDFRVIGADHEALAARAQRQFAKAVESHARQAGRPGEGERLFTPSFPVLRPRD
jgi:cytosine/adenosine deaminase-related metal-dependent hydrolase